MCSDGLHAPVEHNTVLTLVHSLWTQKITACGQKDIEWLVLCWLGLWMSLCICTCRLALKLAELQGPLKRRHAKLQRSGTSLHQFWLLLLSEGRDTSCNFGDSSIMKRYQNWQFNPMFSKKQFKGIIPQVSFLFYLCPTLSTRPLNTKKSHEILGIFLLWVRRTISLMLNTVGPDLVLSWFICHWDHHSEAICCDAQCIPVTGISTPSHVPRALQKIAVYVF